MCGSACCVLCKLHVALQRGVPAALLAEQLCRSSKHEHYHTPAQSTRARAVALCACLRQRSCSLEKPCGQHAAQQTSAVVQLRAAHPSVTTGAAVQDVFSMDNEARMNSPGRAEGNWGWRLPGGWQWSKASREAGRLRALAQQFDRCEAPPRTGKQTSSTVDDPLEAYCAAVPDADECRVYED
jgi:hypothetical protein